MYFQSEVVFSAPSGGINRAAGIIHGVSIARIGTAKGHDGFIDKTFLMQVVDMAATRSQGIKARFGHPNMCSTALGSYLGRFHNYSYSGDKVTADLHLDESARNSPNGNLFEYVLNMAESNPDMFGASLVFESDEFAVTETEVDGKKKSQRYFRLKELRATDIVDEPAATDGLFSADTLPALATQFLDENPSLAELIFSKPESAIGFFTNYLNSNQMKFTNDIINNFKSIFNSSPAVPESPVVEVPVVATITSDKTSFDNDAQSIDIQTDIQLEETPEAISEAFPQEVVLQEDPTNPPAPAIALTDRMFENLRAANLIGDDITDPDLKLQAIFLAFESSLSKISAMQTELNVLNAKIAAKPSLPKNITDPQVSVTLASTEKDETGKQMLKNLPADLKRKLKAHSQ